MDRDPGNRSDGKIFNDHIHGNIMIHPLCVKIIDTPQFQRLRLIKQLGAVEFVYYGATHSRFEHSIGTCYLAEVWLKHLKERLPSGITISPQDELCVMIAGLCHDLGHGPLSSMFEGFYMQQVRVSNELSHGELSVKMFRHLIEANNLLQAFRPCGMDESHIEIIADMINPRIWPLEEFEAKKGKNFLYEIVNNKDNGIDVDKFDYFARDCLHVNITNPFDYKRLIEFSLVLKDEKGCSKICFRDKECENLYKMFELGYDLNRQVYSHKVTHTIHIMLADALIRADPHLHLLITDIEQGSFQSASRMTEDIAAFSRLTDIVIWQIASTSSHALAASRKIISDIWSRKFYPSFRTCPSSRKPNNEIDIKDLLFNLTNTVLNNRGHASLTDDDRKDILVSVVILDFTKKEEDPIDRALFYKKRRVENRGNNQGKNTDRRQVDRETNASEEEYKPIRLQQHMKQRLAPREFSQHIVTLCWRNYRHAEHGEKVYGLREGFKRWCGDNGYMLYE